VIVGGQFGYADAQCQAAMAAARVWTVSRQDGRAEALGNQQRAAGGCVRQQDGELLAAVACRKVAAPVGGSLADQAADLAQAFVPQNMK
jgi:hypothetical protein